jgi:hypothetical protein
LKEAVKLFTMKGLKQQTLSLQISLLRELLISEKVFGVTRTEDLFLKFQERAIKDVFLNTIKNLRYLPIWSA